ncbi:MAG: hypothetical protein K8R46_06650, partial [Pirellulales bacterium]|nr:hypothetical protein [Pirellulales bacterium]
NGQIGKYWIEVVGEPSYAQHVLVWKADGTPVPRTKESALPITLDAQAVDLLIEGLAKYDIEANPIRLIAHFEPNGDYAKAGVEADVVDEVMALVGVNKWTHDDWDGERGSYTGTATAGSDYDTLEQLAKNITGKAEDASELRQSPPPSNRTDCDRHSSQRCTASRGVRKQSPRQRGRSRERRQGSLVWKI